MFVTLVVVSAYTDIPQLEPIREQIESFKSERTISDLSVGETGEIGDIAITLVKYELTDKWTESLIKSEPHPEKYRHLYEHEAPEGAKYLFIQIKLENIGKTRKTFPGYVDFSLHYAGSRMVRADIWNCLSHEMYIGGIFSKYPGSSEEAWLAFEVPKGIELEDTTLNIGGLVWRMIPQSQKGIVVMDSEGNIIYEK